jgi:hypothetical protein
LLTHKAVDLTYSAVTLFQHFMSCSNIVLVRTSAAVDAGTPMGHIIC